MGDATYCGGNKQPQTSEHVLFRPFIVKLVMFGRSKVKVLPSQADAALARRRSRTGAMTMAVTVFVVVLALIWALGAFLLSNAVTTQASNTARTEEALPANAFSAWPNDGDYPPFSNLLKECRPDKQKCLQYTPDKKERIAIMRPPGEFGDLFEQFVSNVVDVYGSNTTANLELLPTAHVPPLGYGKTHGYTKIIRLLVSPLMTQAADLLLNQEEDVSVQDLNQVTRQVVRWHCRLNQVAAHTSLLTVTFDSIISQAQSVREDICHFLNLQPKDNVQHFMDDGFLETDDLELVMEKIQKILLKANSQISKPIHDFIHQVIQDELDKTNNLQNWPCLSFWSVGGDSKELTPVARKVAAAFAPNCSADFAHCGVARDKCEERGDPICK